MAKHVMDRYREIQQIYGKLPEYAKQVEEIEERIMDAEYDEASVLLDNLEDKEQLLLKMELKLKGKPCYQGIKKLLSEKHLGKYEKLKVLYSLATHICIECEKGNEQYSALLDDINNKILMVIVQ